MSKKSIRFFNNREVRAVWDEEHSKWWFSATDIVRAINDEDDYTKAGNYWRWLKKKLTNEGIQLVSATHDFKFLAPDAESETIHTTTSKKNREVAIREMNNHTIVCTADNNATSPGANDDARACC